MIQKLDKIVMRMISGRCLGHFVNTGLLNELQHQNKKPLCRSLCKGSKWVD